MQYRNLALVLVLASIMAVAACSSEGANVDVPVPAPVDGPTQKDVLHLTGVNSGPGTVYSLDGRRNGRGETITIPTDYAPPGEGGTGIPGICAFTYINGGFRDGFTVHTPPSPSIQSEVSIKVDHTLHRFVLSLTRDSDHDGTHGAPLADISCIPVSWLTSVPLATFSYEDIGVTDQVAIANGIGPYGPLTIQAQTSVPKGTEPNPDRYTGNLQVLSTAAGFLGSDLTLQSPTLPQDGTFVASFAKNYTSLMNVTPWHDRVVAENLVSGTPECTDPGTSPGHTVSQDCQYQTRANGFTFNQGSAWHMQVTDAYGRSDRGSYPAIDWQDFTLAGTTAANSFCFITGVGGNFGDLGHAVYIADVVTGSTDHLVMRVFGKGAKATASCVNLGANP